MPGGVIGLLALAGLAWGFARVLDAPRWAGQAIALATVLVMLAALVVLPPDAPFRQSVAGSVQGLVVLGALAVPVLFYRSLLRRLRRRAGTDTDAAPIKTGFVRIDDDVQLVAEIAARAGAAGEGDPSPDRFSVAFRDNDGQIVAAGHARIHNDMAQLGGIWVDRPARSRGLGRGIVQTLEDEARRQGARQAFVDCQPGAEAAFMTHLGYTETARLANLRRTLERSLT